MEDAGLEKHLFALWPVREQKLHVIGWRKGAIVFALLYVFVINAIGLVREGEVLSNRAGVLYRLS
jgi:hypothetical protein